MSQSTNTSRTKACLPKNWRVVTAAGFASVGLACGLGQPALAEWWKLGQGTSATTAKADPAENGFAGTIRRLQAESRLAAEQGDHAKAVKLAERAAKISEAAAQVVGPARECSPEATAKFLADMRTRRDAPPTVIASAVTPPVTPPITQAAAQASALAPQPVEPAAAPVNPFPAVQPTPAEVPAPVARPQSVAAVPKPVERKPSRAVPSPAKETSGPQLFGEVRLNKEQEAQRPVTAGATLAVKPRLSQPASSTEDLLAQSRVAAADGELDRAIELAQEAVDTSFAPSLFGPAGATQSTVEASRWKTHLLAQRNATLNPVRNQEQAFELPEKVAQSSRETKPARAPQRATFEAEQVPPSPAGDAFQTDAETAANGNAQSSIVASQTADSAAWTEDLPPAPAPEPRSNSRRDAIKFSRSVISRPSGWIDADRVEAEPKADDSRAEGQSVSIDDPEPIVEHVEDLPDVEVNVEVQEAVVDSQQADDVSSTVDFATATFEEPVEPEEGEPAPERANEESSDVEAGPALTPQTSEARGPIRLRGGIVLVAAEEPAGTSRPEKSTDQAKDWTNELEAPSTRPESAGFVPAKPENVDDWTTNRSSESVDVPVQRFPVQRVLQLRKRIEAASALNSGTSKANQAVPQSAVTAPTQDSWRAAPDQTSSKTEAEKADATKAAISQQAASAARGPVKLRERAQLPGDTPPETSHSSQVPRSPSKPRQPVVGHSQATLWKSVDPPVADQFTSPARDSAAINNAAPARGQVAEQSVLPVPVSQVAFESTESSHLELPEITATLPAPGESEVPNIAPPPPAQGETPWFEDDSKPSQSQSATVRKSSFGLMDQLAESLKLPVSTLVSLFGGGGLILVGIGLMAVRAILNRRSV